MPEAQQTLEQLNLFVTKLDEIDDYETEVLTPVVLEMAGKLGALNRQAMHLVQTTINEGTELSRRVHAGEADAGEDLERLKLNLRETSDRVERAISKLQSTLTLVDGSINISCDILDYISQVRQLLTEGIWD